MNRFRVYRGLGFRGLGFRGLGFRGLGFRGLGFRVLWGHQCDLLDCASKAELPSQVGPSCIDGRVPIFESCVAVSLELRKLFLYCALPFSRIC